MARASRFDRSGSDASAPYRGLVRTIFILYFVFGTAYCLIFPMWQVTDEISHYINVVHRARSNEPLPRDYNEQARQPRLYYELAGLPLQVLEVVEPDWVKVRHPKARPYAERIEWDWQTPNYRFLVGPHLIRWLNVLVGLLTLYFVYLGARRFIPRQEEVAVSALAMAALLPAFIHRNMLVSNDGLANLSGAILFYLLGRLCVERPERKIVALGVGCALALPVLIKLTVLPVAAAVLFRVVLLMKFASRRQQIIAAVLVLCAGVGVAAFLVTSDSIAVQQYWRTALTRATEVRFNKDSLWQDAIYPLFRKYWSVAADFDFLSGLVVPALGTLGAALALGAILVRDFLRAHAVIVIAALTGVLALGVVANSWAVNVILIGFIAAVYASNRFVISTGRVPRSELGSPLSWFLIWFTLAVATVIILKNTMASQWAHGRYFYPEIGAISLAITSGWFFVMPTDWRRFVPMAVVLLMVAANVILLGKHVSAFLM